MRDALPLYLSIANVFMNSFFRFEKKAASVSTSRRPADSDILTVSSSVGYSEKKMGKISTDTSAAYYPTTTFTKELEKNNAPQFLTF